MSIWWSLHLRREAASVPLARRFLLGTMETAGVDPDISFDLSVALSEACANAVEHGGAHRSAADPEAVADPEGAVADPGDIGDQRLQEERPGRGETAAAPSGRYRVTAYLDGERCRIEVADSGPGFPARSALPVTAQQPGTDPLPGTDPYAPRPYPSPDAEDGRGLCLIEQLADHVHFGNRPGSGAVVSFDKILKWRKDALLMVS
ncbi:ATP-binding protein [Streptomyces sp. NPDC058195]|uniref:ATP-binding protein n=1 Tax=Streptomyces sp. NPDC058195 TaxID=3346375 RepID=UPI0036E589E2